MCGWVMKLYVCDYQVPRSEDIDFFIVEAENDDDAMDKALAELKTLNIPKRYLINCEEVI